LLSIAELPLAEGRTYIVPMLPGEVLPAIPAGGFDSKAEVAGLPGARWIEALGGGNWFVIWRLRGLPEDNPA